MLSFSFVSFLITYYAKPFLIKNMNVLELYSNLSSALTIYAGALYIMDVGEWLKAICFATVLLINFVFGYFWFSSMINIIFLAHFETLKKLFPKNALKMLALKKAVGKSSFSFNLCGYYSNIKELYSVNLNELNNTVKSNFKTISSNRTIRITEL